MRLSLSVPGAVCSRDLNLQKRLANFPQAAILTAPNFNPLLLHAMSMHSSLKSGGGTVAVKRSVLKRGERVKLMKARGQWKEGRSPYGLPKTRPAD